MNRNIIHFSDMANSNAAGEHRIYEWGSELAYIASSLQGIVTQLRTQGVSNLVLIKPLIGEHNEQQKTTQYYY